MSEIENLIKSIEKHPCIWDINHFHYRNRDVKDLAWEQVCKEIFPNVWESCSDKINLCTNLKRKWTNIRDYYRKEMQRKKNIPTGSASKKTKKYIHGDLLHFLAPIFDKTKSEGNYSDEDSDQSTQQEENSIQIIDPLTTISTPPIPSISPVVVEKSQKTEKDVTKQILNMLQQTTTSITIEDDDTKFLLSLRSHMKNMNTNQKIDFQLGTLQLIKNIISTSSPSSESSHKVFGYNNF